MKNEFKHIGMLAFIFEQVGRIRGIAKGQTAQIRDQRAKANAYLDRTNDITPN